MPVVETYSYVCSIGDTTFWFKNIRSFHEISPNADFDVKKQNPIINKNGTDGDKTSIGSADINQTPIASCAEIINKVNNSK